MSTSASLNQGQILEVLSLSQNATAIYTSDDLVIETANDAMIAFWGKDRSIIGKPLEEAVPELKGQPFGQMLRAVLSTGITNSGSAIPAELLIDGKLQTSYYDYEYRAIKNNNGETYAILHTASDVTERELNRIALQKAKELEATQTKALIESEKNLRRFILHAPVAIALFDGPDYVVQIVNNRALELWGRKMEEVLHKPILDAMPELRSQGVKDLLDSVYQTGETFSAFELPVKLLRNGEMVNTYINFIYEAQYDSDGEINGLITIGFEVTEEVLAKRKIEESRAEQYSLNEELTASNEELIATNEELTETQDHLQIIINELERSESRFRNLVLQAPVAICIFRGRELLIEAANLKMQEMLGKDSRIVGKTFAEAVPELEDQPFFELLDSVFKTGEIYYGNEALATINRDEFLSDGYFNFIYQPLKDENNLTEAIMVVAIEVTETVKSRKEIEWTGEQLRLAIDAADLATWYLDINSGTFIPSPRLKELFGYYPEEEMPLSAAIDQIEGDHRELVRKAINNTVATGTNYNIEYPVIGFHDEKQRWVKAMGKIYKDNDGKASNFFGALSDITESKQDELRKNDFIGMVSHELKTPLTSLTAIVQVANSKLKNSEDKFLAGAMEKANIQVKKMSNMINGFLNISRLESGKILIEKQKFEIDELIREIIDDAQVTTVSHTITLTACSPIEIDADRDKIGSVISNLLTNAIKYSPRNQGITVTCTKTDDVLQVSVKDEGMGIKEQDLDKLFDRYYRVESKNTTHISGFGIGLYLSAEIIQRHNGKIWAESETGVGSTFYFTLPLIK